MLIDTHCHLDAAEFDADRDAVIAAARLAGVDRMVLPAVEVANFADVAALAARHDCLRYALGIHPMYVDRARDEDIERLRQAIGLALADPRFVAIGEIGLDHFVPGLDRARQEWFLVEQLRLAREFELPVILHVRRAQDEVLKQVRRFGIRTGIAHAFNGSEQQARRFIESGLALGFGGAMTWSRALRIRQLAALVPLDACVLETDAPDIPPEWLGGRRNEPEALASIAEVFAQIRGLSRAEVIASSGAVAQRVLPRLT
jgi:TatD DNase family protein